MATWDPFVVSLTIRRSPESVRAWWTDLPDDYTAKDPKEQPFRIVTLEKRPDGRELETHWRTPFGVMRARESLRLHEDGSWSFEVANAPFGLRAIDEFHAVSAEGGTRLDIRSTLVPQNAAHRVAGPAIVPVTKRIFRANWRDAARVCEREAP